MKPEKMQMSRSRMIKNREAERKSLLELFILAGNTGHSDLMLNQGLPEYCIVKNAIYLYPQTRVAKAARTNYHAMDCLPCFP